MALHTLFSSHELLSATKQLHIDSSIFNNLVAGQKKPYYFLCHYRITVPFFFNFRKLKTAYNMAYIQFENCTYTCSLYCIMTEPKKIKGKGCLKGCLIAIAIFFGIGFISIIIGIFIPETKDDFIRDAKSNYSSNNCIVLK